MPSTLYGWDDGNYIASLKRFGFTPIERKLGVMSKSQNTFSKLARILAPLVWTSPFVAGLSYAQAPTLPPAIEEWSATSLGAGSFAIGTILEVGAGHGLMVGSDPAALALGVRTAHVKWQLPLDGEDAWAIGLKYSWFQRKMLYSESVREHFDELDGKFFRPSIAWSNRISSRLTIHSMWASGIGSARAELSPDGKRELWKAKHGDKPYPGDSDGAPDTSSSSTGNQQKTTDDEDSAFARRTMQVQSVAGLTEDRFQVTGDWERDDGNRVLLSSRFERTRLEQLETFSFRITLSQEWVLDHFHLRMGGGPQYAMLSGKDLDGEDIKTAGWIPAADLALFWVF